MTSGKYWSRMHDLHSIGINLQFMFSGREWSHIQEFQEVIRRIFRIVRPPSFPQFPNFKMVRDVSLDYLDYLGGSKVKDNGFWEPWSCPLGPKIMKMKTFLIFGKSKLKVTSPMWSRIILRSFWATPLFKFRVNMAPRTTSPPFRKFSISLIEPL